MKNKNLISVVLVLFIALLKRQGVNVKGLLKADPVKEEPQPYIDCTGNLQVLYIYIYDNHQIYLLIQEPEQTNS